MRPAYPRTVSRLACCAALLSGFGIGSTLADLPDFMQRPSPQHIRILCYNVNWDAIFENGDPDNHPWRAYDMSDEFVRIVTAVDPDIVCLQEINSDRDPQDVADILDAVLPLEGGNTWRAHSGSDNVIAARYDLSMLATDTIPTTNRGQAMALVDLPDTNYTYDLYLMNAHFKAGGGSSNISRRQQHADAIVHWIGDLKTAGGYVDLPSNTPIIVLGDLNVYDTDPAYQLTTLLTGDIVDEGTYGPDLAPDWDDTNNTDALPLHNGLGPDFYTWRNDSSQYNPGALDRVIFTDSTITVDNSFVLNTVAMSPADLAASGLQTYDVVLDTGSGYYDHLPLVVDLLAPGGPAEYALTVTTVGSGSVTKDPDQATYAYGAVVDLTAVADPGWTFSHWTGDLTGSTNPDSITVTGNMSVTAHFTEDQYTLTVLTAGNGSVALDPNQASYTYGETVDLTAVADVGWTFDHWSGDLGGSTNPDSLTVTADMSVTAHFTEDQYALTVTVVGNGSVTKNPDQPTYTYGSNVDLTAHAGPGWTFSHWSGDLSGGTNPETLALTGNASVTAHFVQALAGDLNCDGAVNFGDINAFVLRLTDPDAYWIAYPDCPSANGDIDGNGTVGFEDINPFVALLVT